MRVHPLLLAGCLMVVGGSGLAGAGGQPEVIWVRTFNPAEGNAGALAVEQTAEGGFIVSGWSNQRSVASVRQEGIALVRTDAEGLAEGDRGWQRTLASFQSRVRAVGQQVVQRADGDFLVIGAVAENLALARVTGAGEVVWLRDYGGGGTDSGEGVLATTDDGGLAVGWTLSFGYAEHPGATDERSIVSQQLYLAKARADGEQEWARVIGGAGAASARAVAPADGGGYVVLGRADVLRDEDRGELYLLRTATDGRRHWERTFGAARRTGGREEAFDVARTRDGGYLLLGSTFLGFFQERLPVPEDGAEAPVQVPLAAMYLVKTDAEGAMEWERILEPLPVSAVVTGALALTADGGCVVAADTYVWESLENHPMLLKFNTSGGLSWQVPLAGLVGEAFEVRDVVETSDGAYVVAGEAMVNGRWVMALLKLRW